MEYESGAGGLTNNMGVPVSGRYAKRVQNRESGWGTKWSPTTMNKL
ncbi:MAG: hypothetical protein FWH48_11355 [Oscillospiraceae bacterium]|nr:hypothetical protein [Oscillospiraceae bacterium]